MSQQLLEQEEHRAVALDELRAIQHRCKLAATLCTKDEDWLQCLRAIAFDMANWEQEHGAL